MPTYDGVKLTAAQEEALLYQTAYDRDGNPVVRRRYGRVGGVASITVRKLDELGLVERTAGTFSHIPLSAKGEEIADAVVKRLTADREEPYETLRERLDAAKRKQDAKRARREEENQAAVRLAKAVAEKVPAGIGANSLGKDDLRTRLAEGKRLSTPIRRVEITVADLAKLLGVEVE